MIKLEKCSCLYAKNVIGYLNNDLKLLEKMKSKKIGNITPEEFVQSNNKWCKERKAILFVIIHNNKAIGSISLCDIDKEHGHAFAGYWLGSEYWGLGYGKAAFKEIIKEAKKLNIKKLKCKILKDNISSRKIWDNYGASFEIMGEKVNYNLNIENLNLEK